MNKVGVVIMFIKCWKAFWMLAVSSIGISHAQHTLTGIVSDASNGEPLPYASVVIRDKNTGTITNALGEFDLNFTEDLIDDTLNITMLGYEGYSALLSTIDLKHILRVRLRSAPILLKEVVVLSGEGLQKKVRAALKNVPQNYPKEPFSMEGFYREIKKANGKYVSLIEAAVNIYDKNAYSHVKMKNHHRLNDIEEKGSITAIRKSLDYLQEPLEAQFGLQNNLLAYLLVENPIRYPTHALISEDFNTIHERTLSHDGMKVYEITKTLLQGERKIYLDSSTLGILSIVEKWPGNYHQRKISDSVSLLYYDLDKTVTYRKIKGLLYPEHLKISWRVEKISTKNKAIVLSLENSLELLINKITVNDVAKIKDEQMELTSLQWQTGKYDSNFWKHYNLVKDTPLNRQIVEDLEKEIPLDEQFLKN